MRLLRGGFGWLVFAPLAVLSLHSQATPPDSSGSLPTFKAKVQIVQVDVVVVNGKDEPVSGLHKEDFKVWENGHPQTILSFEEHKGASPTQIKLPPMPPNVFTNYPTVKAADSVNVLLLDWLNTQPQDQPFVRKQIIKYLQNVQPGTRLAIFSLGSRLRMVQGLTSDPAELMAALADKKSGAATQASRLLPTATQEAMDSGLIDIMIMNQAAPAAVEAVRQELAETSALHTDERIHITLQALEQLSRYLSSIPGHKNVIWFSSSFPITVFPESGVPRQYQSALKQTADVLTPDQVAIYPVSAAGLAGDATWDAMYQGGGPSIRQENGRRASSQMAMEELAKDTGGQAFYNTNGLGDAIAHVVNDGTRYYTLTYTPTDKKTDGAYRGIRVKLVGADYKLSYRRGYYGENAKIKTRFAQSPSQNSPDPLLPLMGRSLPDIAQVLYKVRVLRSSPQPAPDAALTGANTELKKPLTRYTVDFAIAVDDLKLDLAPDGARQDDIEVMVIAYNRDGKPLNWVVQKTGVSMKPAMYAAAKRFGLQFHQDLDIPGGDVYLCTGVYDAASGKAGTLEIPLDTTTAAAK